MESALLSTLPNLSIGVVAVGALVLITRDFLKRMDDRATAHEAAMKEREDALRVVERDMRTELSRISEKSIHVIGENNRLMGRLITHLDGVSHTQR